MKLNYNRHGLEGNLEMSDPRDRIERGFVRLAGFICRRRWVVLVLVALVAAGFVAGIPKLTFDTSNESFLHPDDPILTRYNAFKDQFGRDDVIIVAVEPRQLFSQGALRKLKSLHDTLAENVPHLNDITSMVNARSTYGDDDRLVVDDLLRQWPETDRDMAALKERVMANPLYLNRLVSEDARLTTVVIELDAFLRTTGDASVLAGFDDETPPVGERPYLTDDDNRAAVTAVRSILEQYDSDDFRLYMAGAPVVTDTIKQAVKSDMGLFVLLAVAVIGVCLFIMFRRIVGVVLPLVVVMLSLLSTLGLMGHAGVAFKVPTVILPSFLLAVGVGASVHVLAVFFQRLQDTDDRQGAIIYALGHSGLAIAMTSLTTAVGLGSFVTAEISPIADLGMFASLGVFLSLFYTVVLLPSLLSILPVRARRQSADASPLRLDAVLDWVSDLSIDNARTIVAVSGILIVVFLASAAQLTFSHSVLEWLPKEWPTYQATKKIDRELKGSVVMEAIVDTRRTNGLYDRDFLVKLSELTAHVETIERNGMFVGKVTSVADILKEIHQALNGNDPSFHAIPADPKLIPQEFLLFENSGADDLENVIDSQFRMARVTIRVPWRDALEYAALLREITQRFHTAFGPDVDVTMTGILGVLSRTLEAAIHSAAKSYIIAFSVITLLMIVLIGNLKIGLASMLPNLMPIVITMGAMWWLDVPLNMSTMLVGSIAIGLAVDDTIHFMHNFRRYYAKTGDVRAAVHRTLQTTGRAMLITSIVLAFGFYIFLFASMGNMIHFGFLTGTAIVLALAADFLLAPALMVLLHPAPSTPTAKGTEEADA